MTTKTTATFSNGSTKTYGGTRAVTAAWAIIELATNETHAIGFSLDRQKAAKTANGHYILRIADTISNRHINAHMIAMRAGFRSATEFNADAKRRNAEHAANYRIEVIDV